MFDSDTNNEVKHFQILKVIDNDSHWFIIKKDVTNLQAYYDVIDTLQCSFFVVIMTYITS